MIPADIIDNIIETARVDEVVGEFVALKKRGANFMGNCPFHNEKTPSFTVSPAKGIFKCFGCGKGGNSVNFIMEHEHVSYPEALKYLANKYGIEVPEIERSTEEIQAENDRESLFLVSQFAEKTFAENLWENDEGKAIGLSYFRQRGFSDETIEKFKLGYSLEAWSALTDSATKKGYKLEYLVNTGLTISKDGKTYDRFRSRVTFPIHNLSGRTIAFGARTLLSDTKKTPKYLNSPETDIYHKSKVLYGIYQAKKDIIKLDNCFLVEGYTDVISLHQSGIENVVASSGTSLTTDQIRLIKRFTSNITILYDGDAAGIKASFRGIDMILEEGMNVKVLLFPDGEDPDSYAKNHSTVELNEYIADSTQDFISFKSKVLLKDAGDDPVKRAGLIKDIVQSIAKIPDGITRSVYLETCSTLLKVEEGILIDELNRIRKTGAKKKFTPNESEQLSAEIASALEENIPKNNDSSELTIDNQEAELVRLLLLYGGLEMHIGDNEEQEPIMVNVAEFIVFELDKDELSPINENYKIIFAEYKFGVESNQIPTEKHYYNHEDQTVSQQVINLLSSKHELSENWKGRHEIEIASEADQLKRTIIRGIYAYKLMRVKIILQDKKESLKSITSTDDITTVLMEIKNYEIAKVKLGIALGRTIG